MIDGFNKEKLINKPFFKKIINNHPYKALERDFLMKICTLTALKLER